jgi:hypothetical protein
MSVVDQLFSAEVSNKGPAPDFIELNPYGVAMPGGLPHGPEHRSPAGRQALAFNSRDEEDNAVLGNIVPTTTASIFDSPFDNPHVHRAVQIDGFAIPPFYASYSIANLVRYLRYLHDEVLPVAVSRNHDVLGAVFAQIEAALRVTFSRYQHVYRYAHTFKYPISRYAGLPTDVIYWATGERADDTALTPEQRAAVIADVEQMEALLRTPPAETEGKSAVADASSALDLDPTGMPITAHSLSDLHFIRDHSLLDALLRPTEDFYLATRTAPLPESAGVQLGDVSRDVAFLKSHFFEFYPSFITDKRRRERFQLAAQRAVNARGQISALNSMIFAAAARLRACHDARDSFARNGAYVQAAKGSGKRARLQFETAEHAQRAFIEAGAAVRVLLRQRLTLFRDLTTLERHATALVFGDVWKTLDDIAIKYVNRRAMRALPVLFDRVTSTFNIMGRPQLASRALSALLNSNVLLTDDTMLQGFTAAACMRSPELIMGYFKLFLDQSVLNPTRQSVRLDLVRVLNLTATTLLQAGQARAALSCIAAVTFHTSKMSSTQNVNFPAITTVLARALAAADCPSDAWALVLGERHTFVRDIDGLSLHGRARALSHVRPLSLPADSSFDNYVSTTVSIVRPSNEAAAPAARLAAGAQLVTSPFLAALPAGASGHSDLSGSAVQLIAPQHASQNLSDIVNTISTGYLTSAHHVLHFTCLETVGGFLDGIALNPSMRGDRALRHISAAVALIAFLTRPTSAAEPRVAKRLERIAARADASRDRSREREEQDPMDSDGADSALDVSIDQLLAANSPDVAPAKLGVSEAQRELEFLSSTPWANGTVPMAPAHAEWVGYFNNDPGRRMPVPGRAAGTLTAGVLRSLMTALSAAGYVDGAARLTEALLLSDSSQLANLETRNARCLDGVEFARTQQSAEARALELITVAVVGVVEHQRALTEQSRRAGGATDILHTRACALVGAHYALPADVVDATDLATVLYGSSSRARPVSTESMLAIASGYRGQLRTSAHSTFAGASAAAADAVAASGDPTGAALLTPTRFAHADVLEPLRRFFVEPAVRAAAAAASREPIPAGSLSVTLDRNQYLMLRFAGEPSQLPPPFESSDAPANLEFQLDYLGRVLYAECAGEAFNGAVSIANDVVHTIPVAAPASDLLNASRRAEREARKAADAAASNAAATGGAGTGGGNTELAATRVRDALGLPAATPVAGSGMRAIGLSDRLAQLEAISASLRSRSDEEIRSNALDSHAARASQLTAAFAAMQIRDFAVDLADDKKHLESAASLRFAREHNMGPAAQFARVGVANQDDKVEKRATAGAGGLANTLFSRVKQGGTSRLAAYEVENSYIRRGFLRAKTADVRLYRALTAAATPPSTEAMHGPRPQQAFKMLRPVARLNGPVVINTATLRQNLVRRTTSGVVGCDGVEGEHAAVIADCTSAPTIEALNGDPSPLLPSLFARAALPVARKGGVTVGTASTPAERDVGAHRLRALATPAHRPTSVAAAGVVYDELLLTLRRALVERPFVFGDASSAAAWAPPALAVEGHLTSLTAPLAALVQYTRLLRQYAPLAATAQLAALQERRLALDAPLPEAPRTVTDLLGADGVAPPPRPRLADTEAFQAAELARLAAAEQEVMAAARLSAARAHAFLADLRAIVSPALERLLAHKTTQLTRYRDLPTAREFGVNRDDVEPFAVAVRQVHEEAAALAAAFTFVAPEHIEAVNATKYPSPVAPYMTGITTYIPSLAPALRAVLPPAEAVNGGLPSVAAAVDGSSTAGVTAELVLPFGHSVTASYAWAAEEALQDDPTHETVRVHSEPSTVASALLPVVEPRTVLSAADLSVWCSGIPGARSAPVPLPDLSALPTRPVRVPAPAPVGFVTSPDEDPAAAAAAAQTRVAALPYNALAVGPSAAALLHLADASQPNKFTGSRRDALATSRILREVLDPNGYMVAREGMPLQPSARTVLSVAAAGVRARDAAAVRAALESLFAYRPEITAAMRQFRDTGKWPEPPQDDAPALPARRKRGAGQLPATAPPPLVLRRAHGERASTLTVRAQESEAVPLAEHASAAPLAVLPAHVRSDPFLWDDLEVTRTFSQARGSYMTAVQAILHFVLANPLIDTPCEVPNEGDPTLARQARIQSRLIEMQRLTNPAKVAAELRAKADAAAKAAKAAAAKAAEEEKAQREKEEHDKVKAASDAQARAVATAAARVRMLNLQIEAEAAPADATPAAAAAAAAAAAVAVPKKVPIMGLPPKLAMPALKPVVPLTKGGSTAGAGGGAGGGASVRTAGALRSTFASPTPLSGKAAHSRAGKPGKGKEQDAFAATLTYALADGTTYARPLLAQPPSDVLSVVEELQEQVELGLFVHIDRVFTSPALWVELRASARERPVALPSPPSGAGDMLGLEMAVPAARARMLDALTEEIMMRAAELEALESRMLTAVYAAVGRINALYAAEDADPSSPFHATPRCMPLPSLDSVLDAGLHRHAGRVFRDMRVMLGEVAPAIEGVNRSRDFTPFHETAQVPVRTSERARARSAGSSSSYSSSERGSETGGDLPDIPGRGW